MMDPHFERAAELVEAAVRNRSIPSAELAIGIKDRLFVRESYGVTSFTPEGRPVNEQTRYDMASMTKIMSTGMIALKLLESGELDLADSIAKYLGDRVPEDKKQITIFHLLTHTSGLPAHILLEDSISDPEDCVSLILSAPLAAACGSTVIYSCTGFILLGKILERILSGRLDQLAEEIVFRPLKMSSTSYHRLNHGRLSDPSLRENTAFTEKDPKTGEWLCGIVHDENARFLEGVSGNAGVFSNINDCIHFARMLACGGEAPTGRYLSQSTLRAAIRNYTPGQDENRGLAFHLANGFQSYSGAFFDQTAFGHTGFTGTHLLVSPQTGLYVILLANRVHPTRDNNAQLRLRRVLHTAAYAALPLQ
ncbi:serine hydrolase domain-containing protein [Caproicibacter sp.]|uniref:serine hydrolase domain-containing protein n=1 Tax=Caproicibacter sp. TaxID=2814884 RepID=UPI0039893EC5